MKIRMTSMAFTPSGVFEKGEILTDKKFPIEFLRHLVDAAGAAEYIDKDSYETKIEDVPVKKKTLSSQSLPPAKASTRKTLGLRKNKPK